MKPGSQKPPKQSPEQHCALLVHARDRDETDRTVNFTTRTLRMRDRAGRARDG
jgi:hypothetical protein